MRLHLKEINQKWKEYALAGCVCILFFVVLTHLGFIWSVISGFFNVIKPMIIGAVIAFIVNPLAKLFESIFLKLIKKDKLRWNLSVFISLILVLALLVLLLASLIPQIRDNIVSLVDNYPSYVEGIIKFLQNLSGPIKDSAIITNIINSLSNGGGIINKIGEYITENVSAIIETTTNIGSAAVNWFVGFIFAIYFLLAKSGICEAISRFFELVLSSNSCEKLRKFVVRFNAIFTKYIICEILDSMIVGICNYLFMIVFGMPNALFVSVIVGVTNLAPTFGPVVGAVIGGFILLLVDVSMVIPFLIFTVVLQTLDGYVIKPKLFGDALNVPGVVIMIALIFFGKIMGVTGLLIAIPVAAILVYIYTVGIVPWLEFRKELKQYKNEEKVKKE